MPSTIRASRWRRIFLNFNLAIQCPANAGRPLSRASSIARRSRQCRFRSAAQRSRLRRLGSSTGVTSTRAAPIFRDWTFGLVAAFRSGFPYSPLAPSLFNGSGQFLFNNRPDLVSGVPAIPQYPCSGDGRCADSESGGICDAAGRPDRRYGPERISRTGLYSTDVSVSRRFSLPPLGEAGRLTVRADAFNVLNHANLNIPNLIPGPGFGVAQYGLQSSDSSGFPASTPFQETPRVIQLGVRIEF